MGYHVYYGLECSGGDMPEQALELADGQFYSPCAGMLCTEYAITWDGYHEDMREFSRNFPDIVFCLQGLGEEDDYRWKTYYKNGKSQVCPVRYEYDEYDEGKLK